ncbi:MAG: tetraacyldisaccharide 4'-kinase [Ignavibacteriales bacterium]|nr:tetraacyldisaccharide 4'-kinase [Ignavibacteriales bacterium]
MKPHRILYPFSLLYGFTVWVRNLLFDIGILKSVDVGVPVISIGNITAGGTGKTPMTIEIAKFGRNSRGTIVVSDGNRVLSDVVNSGDEAFFISQQVPNAIVIADERRVRGAKKAIENFHADMIVLDDGFQHRYLVRDVDIVLFDSNHSSLETLLLPAGYRREPLSSLKRAHAVVATKVNDSLSAARILDDAKISVVPNKFSGSFAAVAVRDIFENVRHSAEKVKDRSVIAVCGIARPESFEAELIMLGARLTTTFSFEDHHRYTMDDVQRIVEAFHKNNGEYILTTEKDAVKLNQFRHELFGIPTFALVMEVRIHEHEQWEKFLSSAA